MKRAFTIVELLVSVGILSVLLTIVVVAAGSVQKGAREKRADVMKVALEQAIATYYAQENEWPDAIERGLNKMNENTWELSASEVDSVFGEIVKKSLGQNSGRSALVDVTALFAARRDGLRTAGMYCSHLAPGFNFGEKVLKKSEDVSNYVFGYPCRDHGKFCRFRIVYDLKSDSVKVKKQGEQ